MTEQEAEDFIREAFEENYELLRLESNYTVTPFVKNAALQQVLMYWRKLRHIALRVTETEIKLTLPDQVTTEGHKYSIEGVVDIVQEDEATMMYDIKTHDADYVRANLGLYEQQLNIYAHIWQSLRGQKLDGTAVIATAPTDEMRAAFRSGNAAKIQKVIEDWNPVVPIPLDHGKVEDTVEAFGEVVDQIENRCFAPPHVEKLKAPASTHRKVPFGTDVCRNCDARFSCNSYRQYALATISNPDAAIRAFLEDFGSEHDRADWLDAGLGETENN